MEITYPYKLDPAGSPEEILDRFEEIVRNEQLTHGQYVIRDRTHTEDGAICGGHKFCAIGSLYFAGGAAIDYMNCLRDYLSVEGASIHTRKEVAQRLPHLTVVRDLLNEVAQDRIDSDAYVMGYDAVDAQHNPDALEILFENYRLRARRIDHNDLLGVIEEARERLADREPVGV